MICATCKTGETQPGTATVTLKRDGPTVVIKGVPARLCKNCGEEYTEPTSLGSFPHPHICGMVRHRRSPR